MSGLKTLKSFIIFLENDFAKQDEVLSFVQLLNDWPRTSKLWIRANFIIHTYIATCISISLIFFGHISKIC
jgi:hypothetical protein